MVKVESGKLRLYEPVFDAAKFRELLVYVARKSEDDPLFGLVKLSKILYYADFAAFRKLRKPITGATYRKYGEGPAPCELTAERRALVDSGDAEMRNVFHFTGNCLRLAIRPGREPDLALFDPEELALVDQVVAFFRPRTEREAAEYSRAETAWAGAGRREVIPYDAALLSSAPIPFDVEEAFHAEHE